MKSIKLQKLVLNNFRGIKHLEINEIGNHLTIRGANSTGKSTVFGAFTWLLFGKDQFGRSDFEIKPLTESGEPIHNLNSEVTVGLMVGEEVVTLKKVFKENWIKPRGQAEVVFSGHTTDYNFNGVPCTMREYNAKIEAICPESLFRLLTNPLYFPLLPWTEQRNMLFKIAGQISDSDIASKNKAWEELFTKINGAKSLDEYKREIAAEKRKIKDELDTIPARIDEATRSMPTEEENWQEIEYSINEKSAQIKAIDTAIADISSTIEAENREYRSKQESINKKRTELQSIEFDYKKKLSSAANNISYNISVKHGKAENLKAEDIRHQGTIERLNKELEGHKSDRAKLLAEWNEINSAKEVHFLEEQFVCPTCLRELEPGDVEAKKAELTAQYNNNRAVRLATNKTHGLQVKALIESAEKALANTNVQREFIASAVKNLTSEIETLKTDLTKSETSENAWKEASAADVNYIRISNEIKKLEESIGVEPKRANITDQTSQKAVLQKDLAGLIQRLNAREFTNRAARRIVELKNEQKTLAQNLSDLEKTEFAIQGFTKAKVEATEEKVNNMFELVKVKMFERQVNGQDNEICTLMVNGVPFSDLNHGMQINSGADVIRTLSKYYGISCPVFFDNSEAINEIIPIDSQTVKLYVTDDKVLTIN